MNNVPGQPTKRTFGWLNATQFLGALNDNIFRWLIVFFLIDVFGQERNDLVSQTIGVTFVIPFLLFTPLAGKLADQHSKRTIIVITKFWELSVMIMACLALFMGWTYAMYVLIFIMCMQSAFFGPCKYGVIPELVERNQLSKANAVIQGFTYLAVVLGTAGAALLSTMTGQSYGLACLACVCIAVIGLITSLGIEKTPPLGEKDEASPFFIKDVVRTMQQIWPDKDLVMAVFASAFFMLLGGFLQMNLIPYGMDVMGFAQDKSGYLFVIAAVGIGIGSWLAGRLSGRSVEMGIVPLGAMGLAVTALLLAGLNEHHKAAIYLSITVMGISAGLFIVPINALIQLRSPDATRGQVVAASGFLGWVGVLAAALLLYVLTGLLPLSPSQAFLILGLLTLILAVVTVWRLPDFLVRFMIVAVTKTLYRIKLVNPEHIPASGPALLVSNHVSWVDPLLIGSMGQRRVRFVMSREIYQSSRLKWLFRLMEVILISEADPPKQIVRSLKQARQRLDDGYLVCIFAEGGITRNGMLRAFKGGLEHIVKGTDYPVIPMYLGGVWGSIFSYADGKLGRRFKRPQDGPGGRVPYPVSIHVGDPVPAGTTRFELRQRVTELSCDYFESLKEKNGSLAVQFIRAARRHWSRPCVADITGRDLTYGRTLIGAMLLSERLKPHVGDQQNIGILLPPSVAGALANIAVAILGKTSVNLSYVVSDETRAHAIEECRIKHILTSRTFIEKLGKDPNDQFYLFIDDCLNNISNRDKTWAWTKARLLPVRSWPKIKSISPDSTATILFSSGSTGRPKGVVLSHHNMISNLEGIRMVYKIYRHDRLCGVLPFFHAFGLNITLWLPITTGASGYYVPNPLDGKTVVQSIREQKATILLTTPTFLHAYLRRAQKEDLATLRSVVAGAEKMNAKLADLFEKRSGIRPQEGYGATELSPLVSINLRDVTLDGTHQIGTKPGSVGQFIPGITVKVVDPETKEPLGPDQAGLLLVKGPNVMQGYLNHPEKTQEVLRNGWYNTGDIASVDESGFITITDRLNRFSKIGGEMVPHIKVEEICYDAVETNERVLVVTGRPHEKKGEELVVLYVKDKADPDKMIQAIQDSPLPNLCKPKADNFIAVDHIPLLGSGKPDFMRIKEIAVNEP